MSFWTRWIAKYDPDQPRGPAGDPAGGQWVAMGTGKGTDHDAYRESYGRTGSDLHAKAAFHAGKRSVKASPEHSLEDHLTHGYDDDERTEWMRSVMAPYFL